MQNICKKSWSNVADEVSTINPKFAQVVNTISPDESYPIYEVSLPYGTSVFDKGVLNLPYGSSVEPITSNVFSTALKEDLMYRAVPIGMVCDAPMELHHTTPEKIIPLTVFEKGAFWGHWEALDPVASYFVQLSWNISAGLHSVFFLPKIQDKEGLLRLEKHFHCHFIIPRGIRDHINVIKQVVRHASSTKDWQCRFFLFGKKWCDKLNSDDPVWRDLKIYWLNNAWATSSYWRFETTFDLVWQKFLRNMKEDRLVFSSYPLEVLKHLIRVSTGSLPAFHPALSTQTGLPVKEVQTAMMDIYRLKYIPTIMVPSHLKQGINNLYCSLNNSSIIEKVLRSREVTNVMQITRDTIRLLEQFKQQVYEGKLMLQNSKLYDVLQSLKYTGYHYDYDVERILKTTDSLIENDTNFSAMPKGYGAREFCSSSRFLRGCVNISSILTEK